MSGPAPSPTGSSMPRTSLEARIRAHNAKRNAALIAGLDAVIAFSAENGMRFSDREAAEVVMHKMRTAVVTLPRELRQASYRWLVERGLETLDDGDLKEPH